MTQALLIIDAQQELIEGKAGQDGVFEKERLLATINLVAEKALKASADVIYIRDLDVADGDGEGFQLHSGLEIPSSAVIFDKNATNAFYRTPLQDYLTARGTRHLVIMGCKTQYCIDTTVRAATASHFDVTVVGDGHSTTDSAVLNASQIIAHHNSIFHGHDNVDHFSIVRDSNEELFAPIHDGFRVT